MNWLRRTNLVRVGSEFSTREILTKELSLIRAVNAGIDAVKPIVRRYEPPDRLGPDQRKALAHILTSPDRFTGFRGLAGSGKSTALVGTGNRAFTVRAMTPFSAPRPLPPPPRFATRCPIWAIP